MFDDREMLTKTGVLERGWTATGVAKFLDPPDDFRPNPKYRSAAPVRLYALERVVAAEKSDAFEQFSANSLKRRKSAQRSVATRRAALLMEAKEWRPRIEMDAGDILDAAVSAYNAFHWCRGSRASRLDDPYFLQRITLNFLRHECSDYDDFLGRIRGKVGARRAYEEIRATVDRKLEALVAEAVAPIMSYEEHCKGISRLEIYRMGSEFESRMG